MKAATTLAEHSAQLCVALFAFGSGAAMQFAAVPVSIAALLAMGLNWKSDQKRKCCASAIKASLTALKRNPDFSDKDVQRAGFLVENAKATLIIDPRQVREASQDGSDDFDNAMARRLISTIDLTDEEPAVERILTLALGSSIAVCRRHPELQNEITQEILIQLARTSGLTLSKLDRIDTNVDRILSELGALGGTLRSMSKFKYLGNMLDFIEGDHGGDVYIEVGVKKDGKIAVFMNKPLKRDVSAIHAFPEDHRMVFCDRKGQIRTVAGPEIGIPLNTEVLNVALATRQALIVYIDDVSKEVLEGYYLPFKVYR